LQVATLVLDRLGDLGSVPSLRRFEVLVFVLVLLVEPLQETCSSSTSWTVVRSLLVATFLLHAVDGVGDIEGFLEGSDTGRRHGATTAGSKERRVHRSVAGYGLETGCELLDGAGSHDGRLGLGLVTRRR
jgi:hypothetical protein